MSVSFYFSGFPPYYCELAVIYHWIVKKLIVVSSKCTLHLKLTKQVQFMRFAIPLPFETTEVLIQRILLSARVCPLRVQLKASNREVKRHLINKTPRSTEPFHPLT